MLNMPTTKGRTRAKPGIYDLAGKTGFARYDTDLKKGWVLKYHGPLTLPVRTLDPKDPYDRALCKRIISIGRRLGDD